ncbi:DNA cytosine methyltransferase, partial [Neisseria meningitidis]|nr:DNA cytosine methyltransferase [Neisseria meningitidis]
FEFMGSTTEVRRQIGNAVPPQGVVELAKAILPVFSDGYHKVNLHEKLEAEKNVFFQDRLNKIRGGKR